MSSYTSTTEELSSTRRKFKITVKADAVKKAFAEATAQMQPTTEIRGFRKGKAPLDLIRKFYVNDIAKKAADRVINDAYQETIKDADFQIVSSPHIEPSNNFTEGSDFEFFALVDINPKIEIQGYKGLSVKIPASLNVNFDEEAEKALKTYASFLGKTEEEKNTLSDTLAITMGYKNLDEARQKARETSEQTNQNMRAGAAMEQVIDLILAKNDFEVAESLVDATIERMIYETNANLPKDQHLDKNNPAVRSELQPGALKQVRGILALGHVARQENVTVSNDELVREITTYSTMNGIDPRAFVKRAGNQVYDEFRGQIMIRKVVGRILELGHVEYTTPSAPENKSQDGQNAGTQNFSQVLE